MIKNLLDKIEGKVSLTFTEKQEIHKLLKELFLTNNNPNLNLPLEKILIQDLPRKRKVFLIKQLLQQLRYPKFTTLQKKILQLMKKIEKNNPQMNFKKNFNLENNYLELNFKFSSSKELNVALEYLKKQTKNLEKLLGLIQGKKL